MSDRLLAEVAERAGSKLTKVRIQSASQVTDQGLTALASRLAKVQSFMVEDVSKSTNPGEAACQVVAFEDNLSVLSADFTCFRQNSEIGKSSSRDKHCCAHFSFSFVLCSRHVLLPFIVQASSWCICLRTAHT